jgi:hypothetical protein
MRSFVSTGGAAKADPLNIDTALTIIIFAAKAFNILNSCSVDMAEFLSNLVKLVTLLTVRSAGGIASRLDE